MTMYHEAPILSGSLPNIYHHALQFDHLRQLPIFTALPPVDSICIAGPSSYRYIRQDDDLWDRLHVGRLTSGYLSAALGLFESSAAKRLKLNKNKISHGPLLNAYRHLSQHPYNPSTNENITDESALVHNARVTRAFNTRMNNGSSSSGSGGGGGAGCVQISVERGSIQKEIETTENDPSDATISAALRKKKRRRRKPNTQQQQGTVATAAATGAGAGAVNTTFSLSIPEDLKLKKARALGSQGLTAVRCAWGSAQEGTTLHVLGTCGVFPKSEIVEAGLFIMEESVLPKEWNFLSGELPPIGSSPDALAQHSCFFGEALPRYYKANSSSEKDDQEVAAAQSEVKLLSNLTLKDSSSSKSAESKEKSHTLEVIEVKNTCPFDYSQQNNRNSNNNGGAGGGRGGGAGQRRRKFVICDRGPRNQLDVLWVPQLQLHMLCTQASSSLLVSRSATKGIRIFRVAADVEFQRLMLCVLRKLYKEHVIPQNIPGKDVFENMPEHGELLKRIRRVVASAEVVAEISGAAAGAALSSLNTGKSKIDSRFFLD
jgi:hypothetical protein